MDRNPCPTPRLRRPQPTKPARALGTALGLALLAWLAACTPLTPLYAPLQSAANHGYAEQRIGPATFKVSYKASPFPTSPYNRARRDEDADSRVLLAYDLALWRASELALQNGYPAFVISDRTNDVTFDRRYDNGDPFNHGCYDPYRFYPCAGSFPPEVYAYVSVRVTFTAELKREIRPGTFDARDAIEKLRAHYPNAQVADGD